MGQTHISFPIVYLYTNTIVGSPSPPSIRQASFEGFPHVSAHQTIFCAGMPTPRVQFAWLPFLRGSHSCFIELKLFSLAYLYTNTIAGTPLSFLFARLPFL